MKKFPLILLLLLSSFAAIAQNKVVLFYPLLGADNEVALTNAEFSAIVGRKLIFKDLGSGVRRSFDINAVHSDVITKLKINRNDAIAEQVRMDAEKKQAVEYHAQQGSLVAERLRSDTIAAEERSLKRRELDVKETIAKVEQLKIEEEQRKREEKLREAALEIPDSQK